MPRVVISEFMDEAAIGSPRVRTAPGPVISITGPIGLP
jgi:hypothetical protein